MKFLPPSPKQIAKASADPSVSKKRRKHSPFFNLIARSPEISQGAKVIYLFFYLHWNIEDGQLNPGYRDIRKNIGCKQDTIRGWLDQLVENGWLKVETTKRHAQIRQRYILLDGFGQPLQTKGQFSALPKGSTAAPQKGSKKQRSPKGGRNRSPKGEPTYPLPKGREDIKLSSASLLPASLDGAGSGAAQSATDRLNAFIEQGGSNA